SSTLEPWPPMRRELPAATITAPNLPSTAVPPSGSGLFQGEAEELHRVVVADAPHHLLQGFPVGGVFAVFHPGAQQLAEDAAEVLVAGVGQKAAGIGEHADEVAQQAAVGKGGELLDHAG